MQRKLVSVIVPVYNVEKYLDRCIESIVNQTYRNLEIILIDDGSTDNCPEICDLWDKKDSRIKVLHKRNGGLSDARNAGLDISSGEYISFIDSDDWIEPDFMETLTDALDNGADIADCATRLCDESDNTIFVRGFKENKLLDNIKALQILLREKGIYQTVWNKLYTRECIKGVRFKYGKYHEDNFWTWKIFMNSESVYVSSKPMYNYLQRDSSIMGNCYSLNRLDGLEAVNECYRELSNIKEYKKQVTNKLVSECLYHLQCVYKYLQGKEKKDSIRLIQNILSSSNAKECISALSSPWYKLFVVFPKSTAKIRNILNIGF